MKACKFCDRLFTNPSRHELKCPERTKKDPFEQLIRARKRLRVEDLPQGLQNPDLGLPAPAPPRLPLDSASSNGLSTLALSPSGNSSQPPLPPLPDITCGDDSEVYYAGTQPTMDYDLVPEPPESTGLDTSPPPLITDCPNTDSSGTRPPRRSQRNHRLPGHYKDMVPSSATHLSRLLPPPPPPPDPTPDVPSSPLPESPPTYIPPPTTIYLSEPNQFGLFRASAQVMENDVESDPSHAFVSNDPSIEDPSSPPIPVTAANDIPPALIEFYGSWSVAAWVTWHIRTTLHSLTPSRTDYLAKHVVLNPKFVPEDLEDFRTDSALKKLDSYHPTSIPDTWRTSKIKIALPYEEVRVPEAKAQYYEIEVHHRTLLNVCRSTLRSPHSKPFVYVPSKKFFTPPEANFDPKIASAHLRHVPLSEFDCPGAQCVYDEYYHSDYWIRQHEEIQKIAPRAGAHYERVVLAICFSSDGLRPANFGNSSICPWYISFGNYPKDYRRHPSVISHQHLAFFAYISDKLHESYILKFGEAPTKDMITFLNRECHNATVRLLISDPEFMEAYRNGFIEECSDGITRCFFPRFFVWSADYPEM